MSELHGYRTRGTVHIVVNNQIGYTTSPKDSRSTPFCTDVATAIQAPIFHVNGDDPLAAVRVIQLCLAYRQEFSIDLVLDIVCYRPHVHNEGDAPSYTQPPLYARTEQRPSVRAISPDFLHRAGALQSDDLAAYDTPVRQTLRESPDAAHKAAPEPGVAAAGLGPRNLRPETGQEAGSKHCNRGRPVDDAEVVELRPARCVGTQCHSRFNAGTDRSAAIDRGEPPAYPAAEER